LIERAAELQGVSVTAVVVASAHEAVTKTIHDFEALNLHDDARGLLDMVLHPAPPNEAARCPLCQYE
jgi:uncharacterized protein (DUF1778 family)